jgi:hypothetical protein
MMLAPILMAGAAALPSPHYRAVRVERPPVIDGRLDEDVWRRAPPTTAFTQKVPVEGKAPTEKTTMRVLYDDDAIYVAFECEQRGVPVESRLTRRDRQVEADSVTFTIDTRRDGKSAFEFYVNAAGVLADAIRFNDTDYSSDYDENWDARTDVRKDGYSVEIRIPLRILRFASAPVQSWGMQARRYISDKQETDEWALIPRAAGGEVSHYGKLDGLEGLSSRAPFELRPFVLGRLRRRDAVTSQVASGTDTKLSAGLDLKWHPSQDLTLDATINPDFGQVEADQIVLNLTTFETYYPEKRPFFLEGIDAFSTPAQLVYTRRIGRAAPSPALRSNVAEQLVDVPEPATIYGASKLTGRIAEGWSVGTLQALTARNDVQVQLQDGSRVRRMVDPLTSFNVMRVKRDVGSNGHVSLMLTGVTHAEATDNYPLDPPSPALCPNGNYVGLGARCWNDAYVGSLDWRWRTPDGDWVTGGQAAVSTLKNGPARSQPDGTVNNPGDLGSGALVYLNKEGGTHWVGNAAISGSTRKLDYNDFGYMQRANTIAANAQVEYRELEPWSIFREAHVYAFEGSTLNDDGLLIGNGQSLGSWGKLKNLWGYYVDVHYRANKFDDREVGDGTALERKGRVGWEAQLGTDSTKRVAFGLDQITDLLFDGFSFQGNALLTVRALPQFDFDIGPNWFYTQGEPRFVANGATPGQYLFGRQRAKNVGAVIRATYTFTPRLTLQTYAQLFLASGHYSDFTQYQSDPNGVRPNISLSDLSPYTGLLGSNPDFVQGALNINLVLRWEYRLGSLLYLVYTRAQVPNVTLGPTDEGTLRFSAVSQAPAADAILVKLSYWWGG